MKNYFRQIKNGKSKLRLCYHFNKNKQSVLHNTDQTTYVNMFSDLL